MLVAFCDQLLGNSTSFCSKATRSPWPMRASRSSHSMASNGCVSAFVKRRLIVSATPAADCSEVGGWVRGFIGFPLLCAGVADGH